LLSDTALSGKPTIIMPGRAGDKSISHSINWACSPVVVAVRILVIIYQFVKQGAGIMSRIINLLNLIAS